MNTKMELASLADVERKFWCKTCKEYFPVKGCGTAYVHKCGHLITAEESEEDEKSIDCHSTSGPG